MPTLLTPATLDELTARFGRLEPTSPRLWGKMSAHEMLCHVADAFGCVLGERPVSMADTWFARSVIKWVALYTPMPWPHGVPTRPELDPLVGGTRPAAFDQDRRAAIELMVRMAAPDAKYSVHPTFGPLTRDEWMRWSYRHTDHHLRQFGV